MKKVLFLIFLSSFIFANNSAEIRVGISPTPKFDVIPSKKAKTSYELMAEYKYLLTNNTEIGAGIGYQRHGKLKSFTDIDTPNVKVNVKDTKLYDSIPIYATVRYNFRNDTDITP